MRFVVQTGCYLVLVAIAWTGLTFFRMGVPSSKQFQSMCDQKHLKEKLAFEISAPKVLIIGASNVMFGYKTHLLASQIGIQGANFGLAATLGLDTIVASARSTLQRGDIAVLAVEYFFFDDADKGPATRQAILSCGQQQLFDLPFVQQARIILDQPVMDLIGGLMSRIGQILGSESSAKIDQTQFYNSHGDFLPSDRNRRSNGQLEFIIRNPASMEIKFNDGSEGVRAVQKFVTWAKANGVTVLVTWPVVYTSSGEVSGPGLQRLQLFYAGLGTPILGAPSDTTYDDPNKFFDTNNHLVAEEAVINTHRLIDQIKAYLASSIGSATSEP